MNIPADAQATESNTRRLAIAVVGGSISGCLTARLLLRAGHDVQVYERSPVGLVGRGGGVATSHRVIEQLKRDTLIESDFPTVPHSHLRFAKRAAGHDELGRCPWRPELDMQCVHWSGLFQALRSGIDDARYHLGRELVAVQRLGQSAMPVQNPEPDLVADASAGSPCSTQDSSSATGPVQLQFSDGSTASAELVVFTDGFRSFGRRLMFPDATLDYRGFSVWRGVLDESEYNPGEALHDHPRVSLASMPGSFVTYLMPSDSGSIQPGERVINWAVYLPIDKSELAGAMRDRDGRSREGTIPAGAYPLAEERRLKALMREQLPSVYADIVEASVDTQFQPVRVSQVPAHYQDRLCLVGDAAVAIQPLTGAGVFKAMENARGLVAALDHDLSNPASLESSLMDWSEKQTRLDERLLSTGFALEQAFIWNTIDLATATEVQVKNWWQQNVHFPADYSYLKVG